MKIRFSISSLLRLAAPAAPLVLATAPDAEAQIVYTNVADTTITTGSSSIYWDMGSSGGQGSVSTSSFGSADFQLYYDSENTGGPILTDLQFNGQIAWAAANGWVKKLSLNTTIDANQSWERGSTNASLNNPTGDNNANWPAHDTNGRGYIGLRFLSNGESGDLYYGWAQVSYNSNQSLTLYDFAYNSVASEAILAGQTAAIPEPSASGVAAGLASLLAGSVAAYLRRRKRRLVVGGGPATRAPAIQWADPKGSVR